MRTSLWSVLPLLAAIACVGGGEPTPEPAPAEPAAPPATEAAELGAMDPATLAAEADRKYALVPSPVEIQAALAKAGIDTKLAELLADRTFKVEEKDTERVAVRTGAVLADALLTLQTATDEQLLTRLGHLREGMATLGGGPDVDRTIEDLTTRVKAGAVSRPELLKEFDLLAGAVIPELEFNGVARVVPLMQAGSWLEGANLVAKAAKAKGQPAAVGDILRQPDVVAYFQEFAKQRDAATPAPIATVLDGTLATLAELSTKPDPLTDADLDAVITATESVLALL